MHLHHALSAKLGIREGGALHSGIRPCGRGVEGERQRADGCAPPGEWRHCPGDRVARGAPDEQCSRWSQQQQSGGCDLAQRGGIGCAILGGARRDGVGAAAVERKAGKRRSGEEGVQEA